MGLPHKAFILLVVAVAVVACMVCVLCIQCLVASELLALLGLWFLPLGVAATLPVSSLRYFSVCPHLSPDLEHR
jgi:hypothetical protein